MKTTLKSSQALTRIPVMAMVILSLILTAGSFKSAHAALRVKTRVRVETDQVQRPHRHHVHLEIKKSDRRIARRLARYTGHSFRVLIDLKRHGYHWVEIGRRAGVPPRVVRAARHARSWSAFLEQARRAERCRRGGRHHHH